MANECFTDAEIKKFGLEGLTLKEQIQKVVAKIKGSDNKKRQAKMQAIHKHRNVQKMRQHPKKEDAGSKALLYTDRTELSESSGVEAVINAISAGYHGRIFEIMEEFMPRKLGLDPNTSNQIELLKAIRGEKTDPKFANMAKAWSEVVEEIRTRFNAAGGDIKKLSDWGVPVHHDAHLVGKKTFDIWHDDIIKELDLDLMGLKGIDTKKEFLPIYLYIKSGGVTAIKPGAFKGKQKIADRHGISRYFKFKDADSQYRYMDKYTDSTIFTTVTDYVTTLSQEIGLMERFGPNPDLGWENVLDTAKRDMALRGEKGKFGNAENAWKELMGKTAPNNRTFANIMSTGRNLEVGLRLPGAAVAAIPDVMMNAMTSKYNGLPMMKVMKRFIGNLSHMKKADRALAARLHMPLVFMLDSAHSAMRFADVAGHKASARFASFVMRASGLNAWTVAGKSAFHFEFMSQLASKDWSRNIKRTMKRYGVTKGDQAKMQASAKYVKDGVEYLDPEALPRATRERVVAMVISETKYAVPEGDALVRAVMFQGSRRGEVGGEILRSGPMMFKNFLATIIANHWARALHGFEGKGSSKLAYATAMIVGMWAMGAIVFQVKEISKGRKPVDWDNPQLWKEAAIHSGIFSVVGDILNSDSRKYGQSALDFLGGPLAGDFTKVFWEGALGSMDDMLNSEKQINEMFTKAGEKAATFVPGQFWYSKLIMERMFLDSLKKLSNPNYDLKKMKREQKHYERFQNERWFR